MRHGPRAQLPTVERPRGPVLVLARTDAARVARDPLLALLAVMPFGFAFALRLGADTLAAAMPARLDAQHALTTISALLLLLTPMMFGFVLGMLLLEERDDGVLQAVAVTELGRNGFLRRRMLVPVLWSGAAAVLLVPLAGLVRLPWHVALAAAAMAALQAPLLALFLGAFAPDKVSGMALAKAVSLLIGTAALLALAPPPWRWAAAAFPHFWLVDVVLYRRTTVAVAAAAAVGLAVHLLVLAVLARRFARRVN